jgi:NDP-sugar pyrophosphorylase family protein
MKALVLAAGKGTRMSALTANCPKPMLPVAGRPLLAWLIGWLRSCEITEIAINLHHLPTMITNYLEDGEQFGVKLTYSFEPTLLGTAGAAKALQSFLDEPFVVVYGDIFTNFELRRLINLHQRSHAAGAALLTMALYRVANPAACGLVELDRQGRVLRFVEKPPPDAIFTDLANTGLLVCEPSLLETIPANTEFDFGRDLLPKLLASGTPIYGVEIQPHEYVVDIGTPAGYERAQQLATATGPLIG